MCLLQQQNILLFLFFLMQQLFSVQSLHCPLEARERIVVFVVELS